MTKLFNKKELKMHRKKLRSNQTIAEKALWKKLRGKQIYNLRFHRQYSIGPFILDFYCPNVRFGIEIDGGYHNEETQKEYDEFRTETIEQVDVKIMRVNNEDVLVNIDKVMEKITKQFLPFTKGEVRRGCD
ncbi:endonuclease domain-containing protein [bacterium]|nr:endonuclease domain-containing protein [bacterium]